jgi:integrase
MPKQAKVLGPLAVKNLTTPGLHFVGEVPGLALQVLPTGARTWILRVTIGARRREMGLGGYPEVSLADARTLARQARQRIRDGIDPIEERRAARSALLASAANIMTFKTAAEALIASKEAEWKNPKHREQWKATLERYAYPTLGKLSVADIELPHVMGVLQPIWAKIPETASRVRGRIEAVLDWATVSGYRSGLNPARWRGHLDKKLAQPSKLKARQNELTGRDGHHAAMPIDGASAFMTRLKAAEGMGARALEFAILTAARSGEVRGSTWSEIDLEAGIWTVPAARMKAGKEHRVPLSKAAVDLLKSLPRIAGYDLVFPAARGGKLSDMALSAVLRRMDVPATPHGFRSTFRDWVSERTAYPGDMAEMALAHAIGSKVEAAYRRGDMFERRRKMMDDWAAFLTMPKTGGDVVPLRAQA